MAMLSWNPREWFTSDNPELTESGRARDFVQKVYEQSGGATTELKRVYDSYLDNERRAGGADKAA